MQNTTRKRLVSFLKHICVSSGECLAFGREKQKIKNLFQAFTRFQYAGNNIKRIGAESANGFIHEIPYEYKNYKMYTVLKSSTHANSDNLMYEYEAGLYVNHLNDYLPCFIETYGLFRYKDEAGWEEAKNSKTITKAVLSSLLTPPIPISYKVGCDSSKYLSLMIQHIKDAVTLEDLIEKKNNGNDSSFFEYEMLNILFQVYLTLAMCKDTFTHYDLHGSNVLLLTVGENRHIEYVYHITDSVTVKVKSKYMAKMIDYGRSYFNDTRRNVSSDMVYEKICSLKECDPDCGADKGFFMMQKNKKESFPTYVMSDKRNMTHDLRLLYYLVNSTSLVDNKKLDKKLKEVLECFYTTLYDPVDLTEKVFKGEYNKDTGRNDFNNVNDVYHELLDIIQQRSQPESSTVSVGELHVYCNSPKQMEFRKSN